MSIENTPITKQVELKEQLRTKLITINAPLGGDYQLIATREKVTYVDGDVISKTDIEDVTLGLIAKQADQITAGGVTISVGQLALLIAQVVDDNAQITLD